MTYIRRHSLLTLAKSLSCAAGDLFTMLQNQGPLPPDWARVYAAEICLALGHLHGLNVAFRDLKPENVVIVRAHAPHRTRATACPPRDPRVTRDRS